MTHKNHHQQLPRSSRIFRQDTGRVGDTVNRAARLESHTKEAHRGILIDGATRDTLGYAVDLDALGAVVFKGKAVAVPVLVVKALAQR